MKPSCIRYSLVLLPLTLSAFTVAVLFARTRPIPYPIVNYDSSSHIQIDLSANRHDKPAAIDQTRYIAYLPHSGFANQRTELVNAITLAIHLNRTLLIPPLFLGHVEGWQGEGKLWETLEDLTDPVRRQQCSQSNDHDDDMCHRYNSFAMLRWSWACDLTSLTEKLNVKYIERRDMSIKALQASLGVEEHDIYKITDIHPYAWDVRGGKAGPSNNPRYLEHFSMNDFIVPHKVLHLYGIFGEGRVTTDKQEREAIKEVLVFRNTAVEDVATKYVEALGGVDSYASIHIRTGDGVFRRTLASRIPMAIERLHRVIGDQGEDPVDVTIVDKNHRLEWCRNNAHLNKRFSIIFVATDARKPRQDLAPVFDEFPCAVTLNDFSESWLESLKQAASSDEYKSIDRWLLTFVDAEIAQQARRYIPSPGSTFSGYIGAIHRQRQGTTYN
ncbi:hypothetical protein Unana1_08187 [Umbelopsis nana]